MIPISEKEAQVSIMDYLAARRIFHYRNNSGALRDKTDRPVFFGTPGSPDIVAVIGGRYIGIEVKGSGSKQSEKQIEFQKGLEAAGGGYILARSIEDVVSGIKRIFA